MEFISDFYKTIINSLLALLPTSPFQPFIQSFARSAEFNKYIGWLNWVVPVGTIQTILVAWTVAIASYYLISIALRWAKVIE